jgi:hypothetical protein
VPAFRVRPEVGVVQAHRWLKNGDHPGDLSVLLEKTERELWSEGRVVRYFRHPDVPGAKVCECGATMRDHGWIDQGGLGITVCPGDWVVTEPKTEPPRYFVMKPSDFAAQFEPDLERPVSERSAEQRPGAEMLEGARHLAEYWMDGARDALAEDVLICAASSANVWKNAAYALAEKVATAAPPAEVPG